MTPLFVPKDSDDPWTGVEQQQQQQQQQQQRGRGGKAGR
ncbi:similar to An07g09950 [Aspergillus luchuensis]|uniref:Similar to An07g09950 n=1 Tax=Aspergillus kawachii TaxID=1069201 RepID=A0A146F761_ASPKA|nr:similar to An07g09950 [Aspergillus luchuensis]